MRIKPLQPTGFAGGCSARPLDGSRKTSVASNVSVSMRTSRLLLCTPREEDCEALADLWTDPEVTRYVGGPRDRAFILGCFREYSADPSAYRSRWGEEFWAILDPRSHGVLGECSIVEKEIDQQSERDLGYFLFPKVWGHGYAFEAARAVVDNAFAEPGSQSLVAVIHPNNVRSQGVARKLGMELERSLLRPDGEEKLLFRLRRPVPGEAAV